MGKVQTSSSAGYDETKQCFVLYKVDISFVPLYSLYYIRWTIHSYKRMMIAVETLNINIIEIVLL